MPEGWWDLLPFSLCLKTLVPSGEESGWGFVPRFLGCLRSRPAQSCSLRSSWWRSVKKTTRVGADSPCVCGFQAFYTHPLAFSCLWEIYAEFLPTCLVLVITFSRIWSATGEPVLAFSLPGGSHASLTEFKLLGYSATSALWRIQEVMILYIIYLFLCRVQALLCPAFFILASPPCAFQDSFQIGA